MKFKYLIPLLGVAALLATITPGHAQSPAYGYQSVTVPVKLTAGTTNLASPQLIDVRKSSGFAFQATVAGNQPGVTNIYAFAPSVDGLSFDTNAATLLYATNFTIATTMFTNTSVGRVIPVQGFGYVQLFSIVTTGTATNYTHQYSTKIP